MYVKISYDKLSQELLKQLPKGCFLTVKDNDFVNTMTIGIIYNGSNDKPLIQDILIVY